MSAHAPRPLGGPITFTLDGDKLTVDSGRKVQEVRLGAVELVRMTYEPRGVARKAFQTRIRMSDGKAFSFSSLSWRSMIEAENLDRDYRAFTRTLFDAIRRANPKARFVGGRPKLLWIATAILGAAALLAMALFIWRALQTGCNRAPRSWAPSSSPPPVAARTHDPAEQAAGVLAGHAAAELLP